MGLHTFQFTQYFLKLSFHQLIRDYLNYVLAMALLSVCLPLSPVHPASGRGTGMKEAPVHIPLSRRYIQRPQTGLCTSLMGEASRLGGFALHWGDSLHGQMEQNTRAPLSSSYRAPYDSQMHPFLRKEHVLLFYIFPLSQTS